MALQDKLRALDPKNPKHWTEDGLPALNVLGPGVKRAEVTAIAPALTRTHPGFTAAPAVGEVGEFGDDGKAPEPKAVVAEGPSKEDIEAEKKASKAFDEANRVLAKAKAGAELAAEAHRKASAKLEKTKSKTADADCIKAYNASLRKRTLANNEKAARVMKALQS